jgi:ketosteroid isomerase-like protein
MADHPNAALLRGAHEAWGAGNMQAMADVLDENVVWHEIGNPEPVRGRAALAARMSGFEIDVTVHDIVAGDEHAVVLTNARATRDGRTLEYRTAEIYHLRDGKITERWAFSDDTAAIIAFFA